jgi:hypothetical protein
MTRTLPNGERDGSGRKKKATLSHRNRVRYAPDRRHARPSMSSRFYFALPSRYILTARIH